MSFAIGVLFYILGSIVVALCLTAISGRDKGHATNRAAPQHGSAHH